MIIKNNKPIEEETNEIVETEEEMTEEMIEHLSNNE